MKVLHRRCAGLDVPKDVAFSLRVRPAASRGNVLLAGILLALPFAGCECPFGAGTDVPADANKISCGCICNEILTECPVPLGSPVVANPLFNKGILVSAPGDVIFFDLGNTLLDSSAGTPSPLFEDARSTIELLKSLAVRLGIITNFPGSLDDLKQLMEDPGFLDEFEVVVLSSDVGVEEPAPGIYQGALDRSSQSFRTQLPV